METNPFKLNSGFSNGYGITTADTVFTTIKPLSLNGIVEGAGNYVTCNDYCSKVYNDSPFNKIGISADYTPRAVVHSGFDNGWMKAIDGSGIYPSPLTISGNNLMTNAAVTTPGTYSTSEMMFGKTNLKSFVTGSDLISENYNKMVMNTGVSTMNIVGAGYINPVISPTHTVNLNAIQAGSLQLGNGNFGSGAATRYNSDLPITATTFGWGAGIAKTDSYYSSANFGATSLPKITAAGAYDVSGLNNQVILGTELNSNWYNGNLALSNSYQHNGSVLRIAVDEPWKKAMHLASDGTYKLATEISAFQSLNYNRPSFITPGVFNMNNMVPGSSFDIHAGTIGINGVGKLINGVFDTKPFDYTKTILPIYTPPSTSRKVKINYKLYSLLEQANYRLAEAYEGALGALENQGPDYCRHFSCSIREIFTNLVNTLTKEDILLTWIAGRESYLHKEKPTRKAKYNYIVRNASAAPTGKKFVDLFELFNKETHSFEDFEHEKLVEMRLEAEQLILLMLTEHYANNN